MALPSSRRPKEVTEELVAAFKVEEHAKITKIKVDVTRAKTAEFFTTMSDWYIGLGLQAKRQLTPKLLKRKAIAVCYNENFVYERLPRDWIQQLTKQIRDRVQDLEEDEISDRVIRQHYTFRLYRRKKIVVELPPKVPSSTQRPMRRVRNSSKRDSTASSAREHAEVRGKGVAKKFVDLTNDPPPASWLAAYATGTSLPRLLTFHSGEDRNILFYDYAPTLKDSSGKKFKLAPQPRFWNGGSGLDPLLDKKVHK